MQALSVVYIDEMNKQTNKLVHNLRMF